MSTIVIGAGLAGLAAARRLQDAGEEVIVLEATSQVGGRSRTERALLQHGQTADLGGSFIDYGQDRILGACAEFGIKLSPTTHLVAADPDGRLTAASPLRNPVVAGGRLLPADERDRISDEVRQALDATPPVPHETVTSWAGRSALSPVARSLVCSQAGANPVHEASEVQMASIEPPHVGRTCWMMAGGADSLARAMAEGLDIRFDQPVRMISQNQETFEITVRTSTDEFTTSYVVVATPVSPTLRMSFDPVLPEWKVTALLNTPMTQGGKVAGQYTNGAAIRERLAPCVRSDGTVSLAWAGPVSDQDSVVVYGLIPDLNDGVLRDQERALVALDALVAAATGLETVRIGGVVKDWTADEFAGGVVSYLLADSPRLPGLLARAVAWGFVHFAGEHTADRWANSMDAALRSGDRAADEVLLQRALAPAG